MIEKLHYRYYNLKQKYKEGNVMRAKTYFFDTLPSTNSKAKELAGKGAPHGTTVIAYQQTGGRGRNGRSFSSQKGGLYMSMVLRTSLPVNAGARITIGAAVAVQKAILGCFGIDTDIKWVNDLYYRNKKICGILAEGFDITPDPEGTTSRFGFIVLGIGINISDKIIFPEELKDIAGTLEQKINTEDELQKIIGELSELIRTNVNEIILEMEKNSKNSLPLFSDDFTKYYNHRFIAMNKHVTVGEAKGKALGIDKNGGIIIETSPGEKVTITSGELSLRML